MAFQPLTDLTSGAPEQPTSSLLSSLWHVVDCALDLISDESKDTAYSPSDTTIIANAVRLFALSTSAYCVDLERYTIASFETCPNIYCSMLSDRRGMQILAPDSAGSELLGWLRKTGAKLEVCDGQAPDSTQSIIVDTCTVLLHCMGRVAVIDVIRPTVRFSFEMMSSSCKRPSQPVARVPLIPGQPSGLLQSSVSSLAIY